MFPLALKTQTTQQLHLMPAASGSVVTLVMQISECVLGSSTQSHPHPRPCRARSAGTSMQFHSPVRDQFIPILPGSLTSYTSVRKYEPRPYEISETSDLLVFGEEQDPPDDDRKRTRSLSHFSFFDAHHENSMISLDVLDEGVGGDHRVLGAGFVVAKYDLDEDEGQEDGLDVEAEQQYVRMTRILRYFTRYWERDRYVTSLQKVVLTDMKKPVLCRNGPCNLPTRC